MLEPPKMFVPFFGVPLISLKLTETMRLLTIFLFNLQREQELLARLEASERELLRVRTENQDSLGIEGNSSAECLSLEAWQPWHSFFTLLVLVCGVRP